VPEKKLLSTLYPQLGERRVEAGRRKVPVRKSVVQVEFHQGEVVKRSGRVPLSRALDPRLRRVRPRQGPYGCWARCR